MVKIIWYHLWLKWCQGLPQIIPDASRFVRIKEKKVQGNAGSIPLHQMMNCTQQP